jgi:hypothetical protein
MMARETSWSEQRKPLAHAAWAAVWEFLLTPAATLMALPQAVTGPK